MVAGSFKVCPLCETLNVAENTECFVCRWQGRFVEEPETVNDRLGEFLAACPSLAEALEPGLKRPKWFGRLMAWLRPGLDGRF
jgi:hypothetical protein